VCSWFNKDSETLVNISLCKCLCGSVKPGISKYYICYYPTRMTKIGYTGRITNVYSGGNLLGDLQTITRFLVHSASNNVTVPPNLHITYGVVE